MCRGGTQGGGGGLVTGRLAAKKYPDSVVETKFGKALHRVFKKKRAGGNPMEKKGKKGQLGKHHIRKSGVKKLQ